MYSEASSRLALSCMIQSRIAVGRGRVARRYVPDTQATYVRVEMNWGVTESESLSMQRRRRRCKMAGAFLAAGQPTSRIE